MLDPIREDDERKLEAMGITKHVDLIIEAKGYYEEHYGMNLSNLPPILAKSPRFLTTLPTTVLDNMKILGIPIDRVDLIWISKMMSLVELPPDWRVSSKNFDSIMYVFLRNNFSEYHPGILYFTYLTRHNLSNKMETRTKKSILEGTVEVPRIGTYMHVHVDGVGKLIKTDLKKLHMRIQSGEEVYPPKVLKNVGRFNWLQGLGETPHVMRKKTRPLPDVTSRINMNDVSLHDKDCLSEQISMKRAYQSWNKKKGEIQEIRLNRIDQAFYNSHTRKREFKTKGSQKNIFDGRRSYTQMKSQKIKPEPMSSRKKDPIPEDPFEEFDKKQIIEKKDHESGNCMLLSRMSKTAYQVRSGVTLNKTGELLDQDIHKTVYGMSASNFFVSNFEKTASSRGFDRTKFRHSKKEFAVDEESQETANIFSRRILSSYSQAPLDEKKRARSQMISKRLYQDYIKRDYELEKIKRSLASNQLNVSMGSLRTGLSVPKNEAIGDPLLMSLPAAGSGLHSFKFTQPKGRRAKKGKR